MTPELLNGKVKSAAMDGVFATRKDEPARVVEHMAKVEREYGMPMQPPKLSKESEVCDAVVHKSNNPVEIVFRSRYKPVNEVTQLSAISKAYPQTKITYDYAGKAEDAFMHYTMENGTLKEATA